MLNHVRGITNSGLHRLLAIRTIECTPPGDHVLSVVWRTVLESNNAIVRRMFRHADVRCRTVFMVLANEIVH